MEESSKPEKKKSKVGRLLSGLKSSKKSTKRKSHNEVLPKPVPAGHVPNAVPSIVDDQGVNATACSPPTEPPLKPRTEPASTAVGTKAAVNTDAGEEKLPIDVATAQERLNKAGEKLEKKLPADLLASSDFKIKASADVNSLADNIGSALVTFMEQRDVEKSEQSHARNLITEWVKKTIPFIETGLTIANV